MSFAGCARVPPAYLHTCLQARARCVSSHETMAQHWGSHASSWTASTFLLSPWDEDLPAWWWTLFGAGSHSHLWIHTGRRHPARPFCEIGFPWTHPLFRGTSRNIWVQRSRYRKCWRAPRLPYWSWFENLLSLVLYLEISSKNKNRLLVLSDTCACTFKRFNKQNLPLLF